MSKPKTSAEINPKPTVKTSSASVSATRLAKDKPEIDFAFGRINYIFMIIGAVCVMAGFMLMSGGRTSDPAIFNPEIFSFRRITLAPIVVILGFVIEVYAIVKKAED